jgi:uncharacterized protein (DUF1501 family)
VAGQRSNLAFTRRRLVQSAGAAAAGVLCGAGFLRTSASAANARDPRFVVIILRGAMDGLSAIPPVGDPDYADLHGELAFASSGERAALELDGFFFAHPALAAFKRMYDEKRAAVIHATATGYRDRSHFDGQDVLESGYPGPGLTDSGWLNRALGALPHSEHRMRGLGVGAIAPLVIRGPAPALGWAPPGGLAPAGDDLGQRVLDLYSHRDPLLGQSLREGLEAQKLAAEGAMSQPKKNAGAGGPVDQMRMAAAGAARLLAAPDGPRVAALAFDGFDTHQNEGAAQGLLAQRLQGSTRVQRFRGESRRRVARFDRRRDHRIRPHRPGQWDPRHRPRNGNGRAPRRRGRRWRQGPRRLAGPQARAALSGPGPQPHDGSEERAQGRARRSVRPLGADPRRADLSGYGADRADEGAGRLAIRASGNRASDRSNMFY